MIKTRYNIPSTDKYFQIYRALKTPKIGILNVMAGRKESGPEKALWRQSGNVVKILYSKQIRQREFSS